MTDASRGPTLTDCDREPIHIPGQIQSFGYLLACEAQTWVITHASRNLDDLGLDPVNVLGQSLRDVIGIDSFHLLANVLASCVAPGVPGRAFGVVVPPWGQFNLAIHTHEGRTIVELEPLTSPYDAAAPLTLVRSMLSRMQQAQSVQESCDSAVAQLRALIDFDRIMVYRFLQDGSGIVISESRAENTASFLGHRYPASDIPKQARDLYRKSWLRLIADVHGRQIPLIADPNQYRPLDLTFVGLRSVSPIHLEYLRNMQVEASLSISIVVSGELWGLIACHNAIPRTLPPDTRTAAELFGQAFSLQLQTLARADAADMLREARKAIDRIVSELNPGVSLIESLEPRLGEIATLLGSHGACLLVDSRLSCWGDTPPPVEIPKILGVLGLSKTEVFATNELSAIYQPALAFAAKASGIVVLPLSRDSDNCLMFFRRELVRLVSWAGNPEKSIEHDADGIRLSPRKSFALWQQEVKNQSQIWEPHDRLMAEALRIALLEIVLKYSELVAIERLKAESQQRIHAAELNHRVKNALALVSALVSQSKETHGNLSAFISDLEGRIQSLAKAHDLASTTGKLDLSSVLEMQLKPFMSAGSKRIELKGPSVKLADHAASVFTLVVHEITTNAAKHGALSTLRGRVQVAWRRDRAGGCLIQWKERGGPVVGIPASTSFGSFLIKNQIPFELGGRSDVRFTPLGVEISLFLPADAVEWGSGTTGRREGKDEDVGDSVRLLKGLTVLLVEDSLIVALETERILKRFGVSAVLICGTLESALAMATTETFDVAVLDINLKGTMTSYPVADVLTGRGIPFIFVTGYGRDVGVPERFDKARIVAKPNKKMELVEEIAAAMAEASR